MSEGRWEREPKKEHRPMGDTVDAWNCLERKVLLNERRKLRGEPPVYLSDEVTRVTLKAMVSLSEMAVREPTKVS